MFWVEPGYGVGVLMLVFAFVGQGDRRKSSNLMGLGFA